MNQSAALRRLELTVLQRLDGILHGDYQGLVPGHGWEMAESRLYEPGDDVRRMDWNVTARTLEPHVRDTVVDRELETVIVADLSASLAFGTVGQEKRDLALSAAAALGFVVSKGGNRVGALLLHNGETWIPPRSGRTHLYHILRRIQASFRDGDAVDLASGLRTAQRLAKRRGLVVVISDFLSPPGWGRRLLALAERQDVIAIEVVDPRELELPNVGLLTLSDPETGRQRRVDTGRAGVRASYAAAAVEQRSEIASQIKLAGCDHLTLRTDRDWVADLVGHVARRRRRLLAPRR